jgi:thiol-disulfide isomerase/thioredoxin
MFPLNKCVAVGIVFTLAGCSTRNQPPIAEYLKDKPAAVFVFLAPDCPLSQSYTLTLNNLRTQFQSNGVEFYTVFESDTGVDDFVATYKVTLPVIRDRDFRLADYFGAMKTPEVFAVDSNGKTFYKGAIDNWAPELGQHRTVITEHYLLDALNAFNQHKNIPAKETKAVGCFIEKRG